MKLPGPPPPRREHLEPGEPLHRLARRRPQRAGRGGGPGRAGGSWRPRGSPSTSSTPRSSGGPSAPPTRARGDGPPVAPGRRHWRLNERHYGALQGLNKKETADRYGAEQVFAWRRSYDVPPEPLTLDDERHPRHDPRYAHVAPDLLPASECLKDVVARMLPYWHDAIVARPVRGQARARLGPRQQPAGAREAPQADPRRRDPRPRDPDGRAVGVRARRRRPLRRGRRAAARRPRRRARPRRGSRRARRGRRRPRQAGSASAPSAA